MLLNNLVIVGLLVDKPIVLEEDGKKYAVMTLTLKDTNECIDIYLYNELADNITAYCNKGDLVGVRGHIVSKDKVLYIWADKLTFMAGNSKEEE